MREGGEVQRCTVPQFVLQNPEYVSEKHKTVLELYNMEIHQKKIGPG